MEIGSANSVSTLVPERQAPSAKPARAAPTDTAGPTNGSGQGQTSDLTTQAVKKSPLVEPVGADRPDNGGLDIVV